MKQRKMREDMDRQLRDKASLAQEQRSKRPSDVVAQIKIEDAMDAYFAQLNASWA